jgi:pimeloyl-ACP methyl ester carboxylesterase
MRRAVRAFLLLASLAAAGAAYQSLASASDRRRFPPPGELIDVGGHRLHICCAGEGSPTVVIEGAGAGASTEWGEIQREVAKDTSVCVYDRGGYGWSDGGTKPRTSDRIVEELHTLLRREGATAPYVLVGHSLGGIHVRHYASRFPDQVAGLVLVDSSHEDQLARLPAEARTLEQQVRVLGVARILARFGVLRLAAFLGLGRSIPGYEELTAEGRAVALRSSVADSLHSELGNVVTSLRQARALNRHLSNMPIAVLSRAVPIRYPRGVSVEEAESVWRDLQVDLTALSTNSRHIIAEQSSHYIHMDQPDVVVDAIQWVVDEARRGLG